MNENTEIIVKYHIMMNYLKLAECAKDDLLAAVQEIAPKVTTHFGAIKVARQLMGKPLKD